MENSFVRVRIIFLAISAILAGGLSLDAAHADDGPHLPPLHQLQAGTVPDAVQCNEPRELYLRNSESPICITPSSHELLVDYGVDLALPSLRAILTSISEPGPADVQRVVAETLRMYENDRENAFEIITGFADLQILHYPYVLDLETQTAVAHGAIPERVGTISRILTEPLTANPMEFTLAQIEADGGAWSDYVFVNPITGNDQLKRSWLVERDGYIFAAGYYYSLDQRAEDLIHNTVALIDSEGAEAAFEIINAELDRIKYASVIDLEAEKYVAIGGARKHLAGTSVGANIGIPIPQAAQLLEEHEGLLRAYRSVAHPLTGASLQAAGVMTYHDGYLMYQGYVYPAEEKVKIIVDNLIQRYEAEGEAVFESITGTTLDPHYPFVFDTATRTVVASGANPDRIGELPFFYQDYTTPPADELLAEMEANEGAWAEYVFPFPNSDLAVEKRSWLQLHDGYVFGSGFYKSLYIAHPDSRLR